MKRISIVASVVAALVLAVSCASAPTVPELVTNTPPYDILQHSGTTLGITQMPSWVPAALQGAKAVEKLPDYQGQFVVVVDVTGKDLEGTRMAASLLNAQTEISRYLSLRVKETFSGAQVGDKNKIEDYMERVVKSVSNVQFSGFEKAADWWVQYRWYKDANKRKVDREEYRVFQLYTINKQILADQLQRILDSEAKAEQVTPDKQKAMDLVQKSFKSDF
ncbi:MAG: hypothetical protein WCL50_12930 [Spirochaetota bacterium]